MTVTGLKGYNQSFVDNIVADSSHNAGVWVGESGGLGGVYTVERNIFFNFTQAAQCGGGEYSQAKSSLCYRAMYGVLSFLTANPLSNQQLVRVEAMYGALIV